MPHKEMSYREMPYRDIPLVTLSFLALVGATMGTLQPELPLPGRCSTRKMLDQGNALLGNVLPGKREHIKGRRALMKNKPVKNNPVATVPAREKPVYAMSEAGYCMRALSAARLGYEPIPETSEDKKRLWYYSALEDIAAQQIASYGFEVESHGVCDKCLKRYGIERRGIHVEINTPLFLLVGHLDRRIIDNGNTQHGNTHPGNTHSRNTYPVEIKSLGRYSHRLFERNEFESFPDYRGQEVCYLRAEKSPGLYWVMNRDTGRPLVYTVNDDGELLDLLKSHDVEDVQQLSLNTTFDDIVESLNNVEIHVRDGKLVKVPECDESRRRYCRFRFLCEGKSKPVEADSAEILEAARLYTEGDILEKEGKDKKQEAVSTLLSHAKATDEKRPIRIGGMVSFTYHGTKQREWLDESTVKKMATPELLEAAKRVGKSFDSYTIRKIKGDND